jgi:hypothetical protein
MGNLQIIILKDQKEINIIFPNKMYKWMAIKQFSLCLYILVK